MTIRIYKNIHPRIDPSVFIDDMALVVGDVTIKEDSSVWPMCVLRGDVQKITIGERTNIQDGSILHVTSDNRFTPGGVGLSVGSDVTVGHGVILHACTIEDLCLIGMGSTILDKAVVQSRVLVGAGSLVPPGKVLESGFLYKGNPVQKARPLHEKELEYLEFSSQHYVDLKNKHMGLD